jgi:hypothetical protein
MAENMQFPIPNSVLEPYIKAAVGSAITAALGDGAKLVELAVQQALTTKVSSSGKVSGSSYDNRYDLVELVATSKIQEIARDTVTAMAEKLRPDIQAAIEKQLRGKHTVIAKSLVDGLISSLSTKWNISVTVEGPKE